VKRIAVSQRLDPVPGRDERREGLDIKLGELLWSLGFLPIPLVNGIDDPVSYVNELRPDGILLSGGNDIGGAPERDALEYAVLDYAETSRCPVLGICRGMQMINHRQGGKLHSVNGHIGVTHRVEGPLIPNGRAVNSYHGYAIAKEDLGSNLEPLAFNSDDGTVEALGHNNLPWLAFMWHPERDRPWNPVDLDLIGKHLGASY